MKEKLIEILVCPTSKSSLKLVVEKREGDDVIEGSLVCSVCNHAFGISEGVPNLLPWDGCTGSGLPDYLLRRVLLCLG